MVSALKRLIAFGGRVVFHAGLVDAVVGVSASRLRVLLYHSVGPNAGPFVEGLAAPIPVDALEEHLDFVVERFRPITLSNLETGEIPDRAILITFDDGYRSLLTHALEPLRSREILPVVFLIGRAVGNEELVWTNELAWALNTSRTASIEVIRSVSQGAWKGSVSQLLHFLWSETSPQTIRQILDDLRNTLEYDPTELASNAGLYLDWDEVEQLRREGWSFGSHTARHYSLPSLAPNEQESEIGEGAEILRKRLGEVSVFAYPFGLRTQASRDAALRTGHRVIMEVGGVNRAPLDPTRVARVPTQTQIGPAALFAEMEVVQPAKAWVRRIGGSES